MLSRIRIAVMIRHPYSVPAIPSGISSVIAASGPYAALVSPSSPKIGIPAATPMCSALSSLVASGRPKSESAIDMSSLILNRQSSPIPSSAQNFTATYNRRTQRSTPPASNYQQPIAYPSHQSGASMSTTATPLYDIPVHRITGEGLSLADYRG